MFTKEQLLNNSNRAKILAKQGKSVKVVLTTDEQNQLAEYGRSFQVISDSKIFFFTDDYCVGVGLFPDDFIPSSTVCPMIVSPRESLPSGAVETAEEYIMIFERDRKQINTIDELVDYLNANYT